MAMMIEAVNTCRTSAEPANSFLFSELAITPNFIVGTYRTFLCRLEKIAPTPLGPHFMRGQGDFDLYYEKSA